MKLLFVYGTLKRGFSRHHALEGQRYLGTAFSESKYSMFHIAGFPALVKDPALRFSERIGTAKEIWGELYEVNDDCLSRLDEIEGVSANLFQRQSMALARYNLVNLPINKDVFADLYNNTAEAYFFQKDVSGARDCGHCWTLF